MKNITILLAIVLISCGEVSSPIDESKDLFINNSTIRIENRMAMESISKIHRKDSVKEIEIIGQECDALPKNCWRISQFPRELFEFKNIENLVVINHSIDKIPNSLSKLIYLESVDFSSNRDRDIDLDSIGNLIHLKRANFNDCNLRKLPVRQLQKLKKLAVLGVESNLFDSTYIKQVEINLPNVRIYW